MGAHLGFKKEERENHLDNLIKGNSVIQDLKERRERRTTKTYFLEKC